MPSPHSQLTSVAILCALCLIANARRADAGSNKTSERAHVDKEPAQEDAPTCQLVVDYSTTESLLRSTFFLGKREEAAKILLSNLFFSISSGFTYSEEQTCLVVQSKTRETDPDIVSMQALALSAERGGDTERLARAVVLSFETDCKCSRYTPQEQDELTRNIKAVLDDPAERRTILEYSGSFDTEAPTLPVRSPFTVRYSYGRRLRATNVSPTNSLYCAYCDPPTQCRRSGVHWCS